MLDVLQLLRHRTVSIPHYVLRTYFTQYHLI